FVAFTEVGGLVGKRSRVLLFCVGIAVVTVASMPYLMTASCRTRSHPAAEQKALESLRAMTRGGVLPAENVVSDIESKFPGSKAAALARLVRARIKLNNKDFAGAADLLNTRVIRDQTSINDYALWLRADAFEQAGR